MGQGHLKALAENKRWKVVWACDLLNDNLNFARKLVPEIKLTKDASELFNDKSLDAVSICTLADIRPKLIKCALDQNLHIIAEKPLAASVKEEEEILKEIEESKSLFAVNLFNRNAWYHQKAREFIRAGKIGDLAIIRICHMTNRVFPENFHNAEGAVFHDCGMHYIDVARWYAMSEYQSWHADGLKMFGEKNPMWVTVHGHFQNGIAFEITNGFVYGLHRRDLQNNSYFDLIGTHGIVHISHDFDQAYLNFNGIDETVQEHAPYGGKKLDVLFEKFAASLDEGKDLGLPGAKDSVIASKISQMMVDSVSKPELPNIGTPAQLQEIRNHRLS